MTSDIRTGHALDEAVAKMMGMSEKDCWAEHHLVVSLHGAARWTFRTPNALHNIVLPWVREQGWEIHINCIARVWGVELYDATKHDYPFIGEALADDMITAVLNALVCASEGQS